VSADVCLIVEGTYPYVTGGVSAWVHQLIGKLPEVRFALFHIAATPAAPPPLGYALPPNVVAFETVGIHGGDEPSVAGERLPPEGWEAIRAFHDEMRENRVEGLAPLLERIAPAPGRGPSGRDYLYDRAAWDVLRKLYEARAPDVSFLDYFWTWRFTHLPIFRLMRARIPEARLYHTVSTGWAGLAATLARARTRRPLVLTEHGIYARERRMEIDQAEWIFVQRQLPISLALGPGFFKELWTRLFYRLSRLTYAHADLIVTLFEGNRQAQIQDGAEPARTLVIPNGVDVERFGALEHVPAGPDEFRIGFVGRIVPIKDVKTFIRALKLVVDVVPGARGVLVGPTDEDPDYVAECRMLAATLGLGDRLAFTGSADVREHYPRLDALVLTSVSEGLPLVVLEAGAAGIPVVATDVGACRELLEGRTPEDRALGASGIVTGLADPGATARALLTLARDPGLRQEMGRAARARVRAAYHETDLLRSYREIYERLAGPAAEP
jgi:glycosyltransferase involved in cell wall biosynthesis